MINHARTLLLNQTAAGMSPDDAGYEFVVPNYRSVRMTTPLQTIHSIIFGKNPDNYFRNYRARELLSYLHQTDLADYVYRLDSRVTYWPAIADNTLYGAPKKVFIQQLSGEPKRLGIGGTVQPSAAIGRSDYEYKVIFGYADGSEPQPIFIVQSAAKLEQITTTTFNGTSTIGAVSLIGSELQIRLGGLTSLGRLTTEVNDILVIEDYSAVGGGEILLEEIASILTAVSAQIGCAEQIDGGNSAAQFTKYLTGGDSYTGGSATIDGGAATLAATGFCTNTFAATNLPLLQAIEAANLTSVQQVWNVSARANPAPAITAVLPNLEFLGEPLYLELFGVAPEEPYKTFQNLWEDHPLPAYRLSGIVLAFIYRMNELLRI